MWNLFGISLSSGGGDICLLQHFHKQQPLCDHAADGSLFLGFREQTKGGTMFLASSQQIVGGQIFPAIGIEPRWLCISFGRPGNADYFYTKHPACIKLTNLTSPFWSKNQFVSFIKIILKKDRWKFWERHRQFLASSQQRIVDKVHFSLFIQSAAHTIKAPRSICMVALFVLYCAWWQHPFPSS